MKIIVQMDPIEKLNLSGDSTFALLNEAQNRGYKVDFYSPDMLTLDNNILYADAYEILVSTDPDEIKKISPAKRVKLEDYDILLMRQDPPFNMSYITAAHLLETIQNKVLVINNPFYVRNCPEIPSVRRCCTNYRSRCKIFNTRSSKRNLAFMSYR